MSVFSVYEGFSSLRKICFTYNVITSEMRDYSCFSCVDIFRICIMELRYNIMYLYKYCHNIYVYSQVIIYNISI